MRYPLIAFGLVGLCGGFVLVALTWNVGAARWFPPDDVPSIAQFHTAKSTGVEWRWVTETNDAVATSTRRSGGSLSIDVAVESPSMNDQGTQTATDPSSSVLYRLAIMAGQRSPTRSRRPNTFKVFVPLNRTIDGETCPPLLDAELATLGKRIFAELSLSGDFTRSQKLTLQATETILRSPETIQLVGNDRSDCVYEIEAD